MNRFADFMPRLVPGWMTDNQTGLQYQIGKGEAFDELLDEYSAAVQVRYIATADAAALSLFGNERDLPRFPDEDLETYRRRIQGAWDFWRWAGTNTGISIVLAQLGYTARIYEHFRWDSEKWAEFSIDIAPNYPIIPPARYDNREKYDDGKKYDIQTRENIDQLRSLIDKIKSAHSRLVSLSFAQTLPARYDGGRKYDEGATYTENIVTVEL